MRGLLTMSRVFGKALLVVTRAEDSTWEKYNPRRYEVRVYVQSINPPPRKGDPKDCTLEALQEEFSFMECGVRSAPEEWRKLGVGETHRMYVRYSCSWWQDYWGECDSELEIEVVRVLRKQKARNFYVAKDRR